MGIIISESKTLDSGIVIDMRYVSIKQVSCQKVNLSNSNVIYYNILGEFEEWVSEDAKNNKTSLGSILITVKSEIIPENLYTVVYDRLKSGFSNFENIM
jgi:hypothetical protein